VLIIWSSLAVVPVAATALAEAALAVTEQAQERRAAAHQQKLNFS
jgi:hypothetical protein